MDISMTIMILIILSALFVIIIAKNVKIPLQNALPVK
jgi:hypothetical protein